MKSNRTLILNFLLPVILVIVLAVIISSLSMRSIRQQFETGNDLQNKNIEVLIEAAQLSEQMTQIHLSLENSLKAAITGKMSNERIYRVHVNAVNSLNRITDRVKSLSLSRQIQEASPQDGQLMLDNFEKYKNFVILTTDISSIDPKAARRFVDQARDQFNDFSRHAHHIYTLLVAHARNLNQEDRQIFDSIFERVTLISYIAMFGLLLISVFTARIISKNIQA